LAISGFKVVTDIEIRIFDQEIFIIYERNSTDTRCDKDTPKDTVRSMPIIESNLIMTTSRQNSSSWGFRLSVASISILHPINPRHLLSFWGLNLVYFSAETQKGTTLHLSDTYQQVY
jgi:hypothetical protein